MDYWQIRLKTAEKTRARIAELVGLLEGQLKIARLDLENADELVRLYGEQRSAAYHTTETEVGNG